MKNPMKVETRSEQNKTKK